MTIYKALCALRILEEDNSSKRAIKSNLRVMIAHMLKAKYRPEYENKNSWRNSILNSFNGMIDEFPTIGKGSLYNNFYIRDLDLQNVYENARINASEETNKPLLTFPANCEWAKEQLVDREFIYDYINKYCPKYTK